MHDFLRSQVFATLVGGGLALLGSLSVYYSTNRNARRKERIEVLCRFKVDLRKVLDNELMYADHLVSFEYYRRAAVLFREIDKEESLFYRKKAEEQLEVVHKTREQYFALHAQLDELSGRAFCLPHAFRNELIRELNRVRALHGWRPDDYDNLKTTEALEAQSQKDKHFIVHELSATYNKRVMAVETLTNRQLEWVSSGAVNRAYANLDRALTRLFEAPFQWVRRPFRRRHVARKSV